MAGDAVVTEERKRKPQTQQTNKLIESKKIETRGQTPRTRANCEKKKAVSWIQWRGHLKGRGQLTPIKKKLFVMFLNKKIITPCKKIFDPIKIF